MTAKPRIAVIALGGTIAMVAGNEGVRPGLGAEELVAAAPGIADLAEISAETFQKVGSFDLSVDGILGLALHIADLANRGAIDGAVVTQGTDTIEETAFLLDCVLDLSIPVVVIGAMRNPLMTSPDGAGNLLAAVKTAADPRMRERARDIGVMVVMLDHIHAAAEVRKTDANRIDAFESPGFGPIGTLIEGRVRVQMTPDRAWKDALRGALDGRPLDAWRDNARTVALHYVGLDESGAVMAAIAADPENFGYEGIVLGAMGGGHVPGRLAPLVSDLVARMPVVVAGRAGAGYLLHETYEITGAEKDLHARGAVFAGRLHPFKARMLLTVLLMAECGEGAARDVFAAWN